ncbi:MAG: ABC transporter ATP-binding protein, partial [Kitasatospora sp.]|nr:ABC transporter ATP-binding protein [Kitasatospora sp.]
GRLLADCSAAEFIDRHSRQQVLVKTSDPALLSQMLTGEGGHVTPTEAGALTVTGVPAPRVGELAAWARLVIHELTPQRASLEEAFMEMTADSQEFGGREPVLAGSHQGSTP